MRNRPLDKFASYDARELVLTRDEICDLMLDLGQIYDAPLKRSYFGRLGVALAYYRRARLRANEEDLWLIAVMRIGMFGSLWPMEEHLTIRQHELVLAEMLDIHHSVIRQRNSVSRVEFAFLTLFTGGLDWAMARAGEYARAEQFVEQLGELVTIFGPGEAVQRFFGSERPLRERTSWEWGAEGRDSDRVSTELMLTPAEYALRVGAKEQYYYDGLMEFLNYLEKASVSKRQ